MGRVRVLERDPDLGAGLDRPRFELARARCTAERIVVARRSPWPAVDDPHEEAEQVAFLVLRGTLLHRLRLAGRETVELLGPGDVVRPWSALDDIAELLNPSRWEPLDDVELAALDQVFFEHARPWPELSVALTERMERRMRSSLLRLAVAQIPQLETRLRVVLWDLAGRFGVVDRDGVLLPVRLRHAVLAALVCASRAAVGRALGELQRRDAVRRDRRGWRLREGPPAELFALDRPAAKGRSTSTASN
jgi:CRP/FNR family transcriptional regulator, cyclic AMP receptor protein